MVSEGAKLKDRGMITVEGKKDAFGHEQLGGIGEVVAELIQKATGIETREVTLGHLQRGGSPSAYDRVLGTRLGIHAARLALKGQFGYMVALKGLEIVPVSLSEAVGTMRTVADIFLDEASEFCT